MAKRKQTKTGRMFKEHGIWVFDSGKPMRVGLIRETIEEIREERDHKNLGLMKNKLR